MYMDTEQEKKIQLGVDYPYDPLGSLECIVAEKYKSQQGFEAGDSLKIQQPIGYLLEVMVDQYNRQKESG